VYRVGGDEFSIIGRTGSCEIFKKACYMCGAIRLPWDGLVPECEYNAYTFGRVGGVYGKQVKYVDADILERWLKGRNKIARHTIMQPDEIQTVMMYYVDKSDRDEAIKEHEMTLQDAMKEHDFKRCSEIQGDIDFLREGFSKLQEETNFESKDEVNDYTQSKKSTY